MYDCQSGTSGRCFSWELAEKQWGNSTITRNLPSSFSYLNLKNSDSVVQLGVPFNTTFKVAPEFGAFALKIKQPTLSYNHTRSVLNFDHLLNGSKDQLYYISEFEKNLTYVEKDLNYASG
mmetsp:Transcript_8456/g.1163  ORF Transcript_8456/g.1163 Transcript_8456/m.1163 type:complete len:120 (+) Transcript_8456:1742-2101(+)